MGKLRWAWKAGSSGVRALGQKWSGSLECQPWLWPSSMHKPGRSLSLASVSHLYSEGLGQSDFSGLPALYPLLLAVSP